MQQERTGCRKERKLQEEDEKSTDLYDSRNDFKRLLENTGKTQKKIRNQIYIMKQESFYHIEKVRLEGLDFFNEKKNELANCCEIYTITDKISQVLM